MRFVRAALAAAGLCAMATAAAAQQAPTQPAPAAPRPPAVSSAKAHRWFDLQAGTLDARYRLIDNSAGMRTSNLLQHKQTLRAGLKFDPKGRYSLQTSLGTGNSFTGSWEATGLGTGSPTWAFNVRTLYLSAQPVKGLEVHVGGLAATTRGESTEITAYDNDGYLVGERVSVKRGNELFFDELSATFGYLGDTSTPNVFKRLDSLDNHNYTQLLVGKKLSARAAASADWTRVSGVDTWREAVRVGTKELRVVDSVRLELYQRIDASDGEGFAVTLDKTLSKIVAVSGGYASIDPQAPTLNGDRYLRGRRVFAEGRVAVTPELTVSVFYGHAINNDFPVPNKKRFDLVASYNVLKALQRSGAW